MSSSDDGEHLKAGHPPAVKAGGMRIQQKVRPHKSEKDPNADEGDDHINTLTASTSPPKATKVGGALMRGNADFPTEAVQHFHKPPPASQYNNPPHNKHISIQQPRKD